MPLQPSSLGISPIADLYAQATLTGELTVADRHSIRNAFLNGTIDEEAQRCVDRLVYAVRRGRLSLI
jgi:hypothetical protein